MRLAIVRTSSSPVNRHFYNVQELGLARSLTRHGFAVDIYSAERSSRRPRSEEVPVDHGVVHLYYWPVWIALPHHHCLLAGLDEHILNENYDIVQIQDSYSIASAQLAFQLRHFNGPIVLQQGVYLHPVRWKRWVQVGFEATMGSFLRTARPVCLAKTAEAAKYLVRFGYERPTLLPIGFDDAVFRKRGCSNSTRSALDIQPQDLLLLYVGRIERRRNPGVLIQVCKRLRDKGIPAHLVIAGEGTLEQESKQMAIEYQLTSAIHFVGCVPQADLSSYYRSADFLVHASHHEIVGMVFLEALYHGLPVITSDTPGARSIITQAVDGYIVQSLSVAEWTTLIQELWANPLARQQLSEMAQKKAGTFMWESLASSYADFYSRVLNGLTDEFAQHHAAPEPARQCCARKT